MAKNQKSENNEKILISKVYSIEKLINVVSSDLLVVKNKTLKKKNPFFYYSQLAGTILILGAWIIQNFGLYNIDKDLKEVKSHSSIIVDLIKYNDELAGTIDLRKGSDPQDINLEAHFSILEMSSNYILNLIQMQDYFLENIPDNFILNQKVVLSTSFKNDLKEDLKINARITDSLRWTGSIKDMDFWRLSCMQSYGNYSELLSAFKNLADQHQVNYDNQKRKFIVSYLIGGSFLIISLFKDFPTFKRTTNFFYILIIVIIILILLFFL